MARSFLEANSVPQRDGRWIRGFTDARTIDVIRDPGVDAFRKFAIPRRSITMLILAADDVEK